MNKKLLIGILLAVVSLVLMGISLATPWYHQSVELTLLGTTTESDTKYYLNHVECEIDGETESTDYDDLEDNKVVDTFHTTQTMAILGVVGTILALLGVALVAMKKLGKKIAIILVLVGLILAIIAPLYLMATLPGAFKEAGEIAGEKGPHKSFSGSSKEGGEEGEYKNSWGPATAWYLALVAALLLIIPLILLLIYKPE